MENCRSCGGRLIVKSTKRTPQQLKKPYYYTAYYFCPRCQKIYHNEKFKVINDNYELFTSNSLDPKDIEVEIWTDGACSNNGRPNAKAAWAFVSGEYEESGLVLGKQTNNTAEGLAILHALKWAAAKGYKKIKIYSDSQISLNNLLKRIDMIKENKQIFSDIFDTINTNNLVVVYEKVLGHSGDINNERADKLANGLVGIR
jgi:ribonuclease HI